MCQHVAQDASILTHSAECADTCPIINKSQQVGHVVLQKLVSQGKYW